MRYVLLLTLPVVLLAVACGGGEQAPGASVGGKIAFTSCRYPDEEGEGPTCYISAMNADGSGLRKLTEAGTGAPAWSPDGARIAFVSDDLEISIINADGSGRTKLVDDGSFVRSAAFVVWSPDGIHIAFIGGSAFDIHLVNVDGSGQRNLTNNAFLANEYLPTWAPDGRRIAFAAESGGNHDIYVISADGSGLTRITNFNAEHVTGLGWSPDGGRLAFTFCSPQVPPIPGRETDEICRLYVANADGSGLTQLSQGGQSSGGGSLSWSPDGTRIAFDRDRDIFIIHVDGSGLTALTTGGAHDPVWSPDGSRIAFGAWRGDDPDIFIVNADGSGLTHLTESSESESIPAWQPRP